MVSLGWTPRWNKDKTLIRGFYNKKKGYVGKNSKPKEFEKILEKWRKLNDKN